ncbi:hypothetical protein GCM10022420_093020 [Streptomyces iranensis]
MTAGIAELIPGGGTSHEGIRKEPAEGTTAGSDPPFRHGPCCHDWGAQERKGIDECAERRTKGARRGARKERRPSANPQITRGPYRLVPRRPPRAATSAACARWFTAPREN